MQWAAESRLGPGGCGPTGSWQDGPGRGFGPASCFAPLAGKQRL